MSSAEFNRAPAFLLAGIFLAAEPAAQAQPVLAQVARTYGIVQLQGPFREWTTIAAPPAALAEGDQVRTGPLSSAVVTFADGSRLELGSDTSFTLEEASAQRVSMKVSMGRLKASVTRQEGARFEVRTPMAVCFVRGTEFLVIVAAGGRTTVDLYKGLLGVADQRGHEILLHPGQRLAIDVRGMAVPERAPSLAEIQRQDFHAGMRREIGLDAAKRAALAAAARELELAEYQQGRVMIGLNGERMRVEQYMLRPQADQFEFVSLSGRPGSLDYFYYLGTFNRKLPTDIGPILSGLAGGPSSPDYYLSAYETGRSNRADSIRESAQGGHPVDVNGNSDLADNVDWYFDGSANRSVATGGGRFYETLFDRYGFYVNGKLKYGWSGSNIASDSERSAASNTDPLTGASLDAANAYLDSSGLLATRVVNETFPDPARVHQRVY